LTLIKNGNVRKADEVEALYCALQVAHILNEDEFKKEIHDAAKSYDSREMKSNTTTSQTFKEILYGWQELQSVIIDH
jgi:hypothetical protein